MNPEDFEINAIYVDIDTRYKNDSLFIYKGITMTGLMVFENYYNGELEDYKVFHLSDFDENDGSFLCRNYQERYYFVPLMGFLKDILELSLTGLMHKHTTPRANTP